MKSPRLIWWKSAVLFGKTEEETKKKPCMCKKVIKWGGRNTGSDYVVAVYLKFIIHSGQYRHSPPLTSPKLFTHIQEMNRYPICPNSDVNCHLSSHKLPVIILSKYLSDESSVAYYASMLYKSIAKLYKFPSVSSQSFRSLSEGLWPLTYRVRHAESCSL